MIICGAINEPNLFSHNLEVANFGNYFKIPSCHCLPNDNASREHKLESHFVVDWNF